MLESLERVHKSEPKSTHNYLVIYHGLIFSNFDAIKLYKDLLTHTLQVQHPDTYSSQHLSEYTSITPKYDRSSVTTNPLAAPRMKTGILATTKLPRVPTANLCFTIESLMAPERSRESRTGSTDLTTGKALSMEACRPAKELRRLIASLVERLLLLDTTTVASEMDLSSALRDDLMDLPLWVLKACLVASTLVLISSRAFLMR